MEVADRVPIVNRTVHHAPEERRRPIMACTDSEPVGALFYIFANACNESRQSEIQTMNLE